MPHRIGAGRQAALVQGHEEPNGACARVVALRGRPCALLLHEARDVPIEVELRPVNLEIHGMRNPLGEYLLRRPRSIWTAFWEVDHRLLGTPQVERRSPAVHGFP